MDYSHIYYDNKVKYIWIKYLIYNNSNNSDNSGLIGGSKSDRYDEHYKYPYYKFTYDLDVKHFNDLCKNFKPKIIDYLPKNMRSNTPLEKFDDKYLLIEEDWRKNEELNNFTDYFTEDCRIRCKFANSKSPYKYWKYNKEILLEKTRSISKLRDIIYSKTKMCNNFRISVALSVLDIFSAKKWLDISAGWGDRLIAAIAHGVDKYISVDPNSCLTNKYEKIINTLVPEDLRKNFHIYYDGFETADIPDEKFDLVFSSPPFFDLEVYSEDASDSLVKYPSKTDWYNNFLIKSLDKAYDHLSIGGNMVLYMGEGIKTQYIEDMKKYLDSKMKYRGTIYYYYPNKMVPRPMYVWQKLDNDIDLIQTGSSQEHMQIKDIDLNPELVIKSEKVDDRTFHIVRDDFLVGGTKQRMLYDIMKNSKCEEFVYAGPVYGYAQIALSYVSKILNKKATLFLEKKRPLWPLTKAAAGYGANLIEIQKNPVLKKVQKKAEDYVDAIKKEKGSDYICLLPFGLGSKEYIDTLGKQIEKAVPSSVKNNMPKRMWVVGGSATLLNALYKVFPDTVFKVVQVGKKIWPDQLDLKRTELFVSDEKFTDVAKIQPPYPTVKTYDAKLWKYVLEHGEDGDYVWNVGKDV